MRGCNTHEIINNDCNECKTIITRGSTNVSRLPTETYQESMRRTETYSQKQTSLKTDKERKTEAQRLN